MVDQDLGEATIVYEDSDDETVRKTVENEHVAYFQDHWIVKTGEDDRGRDTIMRIPATRVYHVERTVEAFEEEVATLTDQVRSFTDDLRRMIPVGGEGGEHRRRERQDPVDIEVEPTSEAGREADDVDTPTDSSGSSESGN